VAQNKSLTVSFFGRDVSLNRTLDGIKKNTFATSNVLESASRKSTYLIAGLGAAAVKFAKAAADDEKAAISLANTLKTVTGASAVQIANVEKFIKKSEMFAAVADDKIRPAFDTLVRSTGSAAKSQKMLTLALEIAQKQGVEVGQVTDAMAKASRGQFKALTNLTKIAPKTAGGNKQYTSSLKVMNGQIVTVTKSLGTTKKVTEDLDSYLGRLGDSFNGSIKAISGTSSFKIEQFNLAMNNVQETLGGLLLPYLNDLADWLVKIEPWVTKNKDTIKNWGVALLSVAVGVKAINAAFKLFQAAKLIGAIMGVGEAAAAAGASGAAGGVAITAAWAPFFAGVAAIGGLAALGYFAFNAYKNRNITPDLGAKGSLLNPKTTTPFNMGGLGTGKSSTSAFSSLYGQVPKMASGGIVSRPTIAMIGEAGPEAVVPLGKGGMGVTIVNYIQGSVVTEKELALRIRNDMAQLLRRKGINPAVLGV
jgi:hypothetical protein